jgi:hypothetical protein
MSKTKKKKMAFTIFTFPLQSKDASPAAAAAEAAAPLYVSQATNGYDSA